MVVNNYWNYASFFGKNVPEITDFVYNVPGVIAENGSTYDLVVGMNNATATFLQCEKNYAIRNNLFAKVGGSNTDESASQNCLMSDYTSYFSNFTSSISSSVDMDKIKLIVTISGTNSSGRDRTLCELGIFKNVYAWNGNILQTNVMFVRHVLDEPIFVPANESFTKTYQWIEQ